MAENEKTDTQQRQTITTQTTTENTAEHTEFFHVCDEGALVAAGHEEGASEDLLNGQNVEGERALRIALAHRQPTHKLQRRGEGAMAHRRQKQPRDT